jgi:hypothetical protein
MLKRNLFLMAVSLAAQACATTPQDEAPANNDDQGDEMDGDQPPQVDVCSATDGVCIDKLQCATDPDCDTPPPPPGCTPNALPAAPNNLVSSVTGLFSPQEIAATGSNVFMIAYPNSSPGYTRLYRCPTTGCPATPQIVANDLDDWDSFVATAGSNVYWSSRTQPGSGNVNQIMRANADGSSPEVLLSVSDGAGYYGEVSKNVAVYDDYALLVDVTARSSTSATATSRPGAGIHAITDSLISPSLPGISAPAYTNSTVAGDDNYIAYHAQSNATVTAPYDSKIHIYDLDGAQVGVTSTTYSWMSHMEIVGNSLLFMNDTSWYACSLPACSDVKEVGTAVKRRGFTFAVANDRVYFASIADQGCGQGNTGVLASCTVASLVAGTCTPTLHSASFHWVNLRSLSVTPTQAFMTSRTASTSAFSTSL